MDHNTPPLLHNMAWGDNRVVLLIFGGEIISKLKLYIHDMHIWRQNTGFQMVAVYVSFLRKLWRDVCGDKGARKQKQETGHYAGEQHGNPPHEPVPLARRATRPDPDQNDRGWSWEVTCYLWTHGK